MRTSLWSVPCLKQAVLTVTQPWFFFIKVRRPWIWTDVGLSGNLNAIANSSKLPPLQLLLSMFPRKGRRKFGQTSIPISPIDWKRTPPVPYPLFPPTGLRGTPWMNKPMGWSCTGQTPNVYFLLHVCVSLWAMEGSFVVTQDRKGRNGLEVVE